MPGIAISRCLRCGGCAETLGTEEVGMKGQWIDRTSLVGVAVLALWTGGAWAQAPAAPSTAPAGKIAAVVNGETIPEDDVDQVATMVIKDRFKLQQQPTEQQRHEVRMEVISMSIDDVLMRQFLAKCNVK